MQELHHSTKPGRRPVALWVVTMVAAGALVLSMTMVTAEELPSGQPGGAAEHEALFAEDRFPSATTCAPCHEDIYREWSVSAHAYAQLSPVFNAMHAKITKLTNGTNGDFCIRIRLPGAGLIFSSGNRRKWTEPPGKLLHDEVVPAQICRHRGVGLCGCEGVGNEGRLAGRRTCAEHVAVESAHGRLAVPLSPRQLVGASSAATVGPGGSLAGRWVWRLPRRIPVPHGGARPRGSRRWRRRDEDTRRGPTPRTAASCLVAFPPLAAKPTGRGLGRRRDGAD